MDSPSSCLKFRHPRARYSFDAYLAKTIFDGTKLPLVVAPAQNHTPWYEITFSPLFDDQESRHFATLANENSVDRSRPIEFIRDGLI
jgi:hypothetical protein